MRPRLVAAFFLMIFGALLLVLDLSLHGRDFDGYTAAAFICMFTGAIFTEPERLAPAFKIAVDAVTNLIPWVARRRKSGTIHVIPEHPRNDNKEEI